MNFQELVQKLDFPEEVESRLKEIETGLGGEEELSLCMKLTGEEYDAAYRAAKELLVPDEDGFRMLKLMLKAAAISYERYLAAKIDGEIFLDTMKCFPRFLEENKKGFHRYFFDRGFWTGRQTSLTLFRLGSLEYERAGGEAREIAVHIPSDADLSKEAVDESLKIAKSFFAEKFPLYASAKYTCDSWLLSPALEKLLPKSSRILSFKERFEVRSVNDLDESYKLWVYGNPELRPEEFPEHTTLQRNIKAFVLGGGKIGEALGVLK